MYISMLEGQGIPPFLLLPVHAEQSQPIASHAYQEKGWIKGMLGGIVGSSQSP